jgi:hypothetical protein
MQNITTSAQLKETIILLEKRKIQQEIVLKEQFHETCEKLKPSTLIKETLIDVTTAPDLKANVIDTAIGMATGFLTKKIVSGGSKNPFMKLLGIVLEVGVANFVTKHPGNIKSMGSKVMNDIFIKKKEEKN